jgi:hypothetical protein
MPYHCTIKNVSENREQTQGLQMKNEIRCALVFFSIAASFSLTSPLHAATNWKLVAGGQIEKEGMVVANTWKEQEVIELEDPNKQWGACYVKEAEELGRKKVSIRCVTTNKKSVASKTCVNESQISLTLESFEHQKVWQRMVLASCPR